jgi:Fur family peroxide stress response transcriptional regulator
MRNIGNLGRKLAEHHLKVTPQRLAVLQAFETLHHHPSADQIIEHVRKKNPNIASGTVYKILETFVDKGILCRVKTEADKMRYDPIIEKHHHLYDLVSDRIEDFADPDLQGLIEGYIRKKKIPGFEVEDVRIQILGRFSKSASPKE